MPRKTSKATRSTQKQGTDGKADEEVDMINMSLCSSGDKEERLAMFLNDFEAQVKSRVEKAEAEINTVVSQLKNIMSIELFKIPKEIRQMKRSEFLAKGGNIETLSFDDVSDAMLEMTETDFGGPFEDLTNTQGRGPATGKRKNARTGKPISTKGSRSTRAKQGAEECNPLLTPAYRGKMATPLTITPKFDTRLPFPVGRDVKPGEPLISLAGSPVVVSNKDGKAGDVATSVGAYLEDGSPNTQQRNLMKLKALVDSKLRELRK